MIASCNVSCVDIQSISSELTPPAPPQLRQWSGYSLSSWPTTLVSIGRRVYDPLACSSYCRGNTPESTMPWVSSLPVTVRAA